MVMRIYGENVINSHENNVKMQNNNNLHFKLIIVFIGLFFLKLTIKST